MNPSVSLNPARRTELLDFHRKNPDSEIHFRAHILLLLADGHPWQVVGSFLSCSIDRWLERFQEEGLDGLCGRKRGHAFRFSRAWARIAIHHGHAIEPASFWLAPQSMDLHLGRFGLVPTLRPPCQPRDGPPAAPSRRPGLPPSAPGRGTP